MKISKLKLIIFYIIVFNFIALNLFSQTIDEAKKYADSLFFNQNYELSLKTYERIFFFQQNDSINKSKNFENIAKVYFQQKKYDLALQNYDSAFFYEKKINYNIDKQIDLKFKIINCLIQTSKYQKSLIELFSLPDSLNYNDKQQQNFYLGISFYNLANYESASKYFVLSIDSLYITQKNEIEELLSKNKYLNKPNKKIAFRLSLIFPGAGQFYSGDFIEGTNSLLLTTFIVFLAYKVTINYSILDCIISVLPFFQRYYLGGAKNAYEIAIQKRIAKQTKNYNKILEIILSTK